MKVELASRPKVHEVLPLHMTLCPKPGRGGFGAFILLGSNHIAYRFKKVKVTVKMVIFSHRPQISRQGLVWKEHWTRNQEVPWSGFCGLTP